MTIIKSRLITWISPLVFWDIWNRILLRFYRWTQRDKERDVLILCGATHIERATVSSILLTSSMHNFIGVLKNILCEPISKLFLLWLSDRKRFPFDWQFRKLVRWYFLTYTHHCTCIFQKVSCPALVIFLRLWFRTPCLKASSCAHISRLSFSLVESLFSLVVSIFTSFTDNLQLNHFYSHILSIFFYHEQDNCTLYFYTLFSQLFLD